ncbi:MAG: XrtA system polysaccharide deacetylase [Acidobacteriota bacterium]
MPDRETTTETLEEEKQPRQTALAAPAVLTIDLEDYYQVSAFKGTVRPEDWSWYPSRVERNVERLLDMLDEYGVKATWFTLGWEASRRGAMVRKVVERGHEVACHSYWHREVWRLAPDEFAKDTRDAKQAVEDAAGVAVTGYRAPSFSIRNDSLWALSVLAEAGFTYDSSIFPVYHPNYGIPKAPHRPYVIETRQGSLVELPPATAPLFGRRMAVAGGAYMRHFPISVIERSLRGLTRREQLPAIIYLHPWEIDPRQPRLKVSLATRLRHYRGLSKMEKRLRRLLGSMEFVTAGELAAQTVALPHLSLDGLRALAPDRVEPRPTTQASPARPPV